jgi:uncharacterized membrane protein YhdT
MEADISKDDVYLGDGFSLKPWHVLIADVTMCVIAVISLSIIDAKLLVELADVLITTAVRAVGIMQALCASTPRGLVHKMPGSDMISISFLYLISRTVYSSKMSKNGTLPGVTIALLFLNLVINAVEGTVIRLHRGKQHLYQLPQQSSEDEVTAADDRVPAKSPTPSHRRPFLDGLDVLRFLASLHIVLFHFYNTGNHSYTRFVSWGASGLTLFFVLSGFVLAYQYGDRCGGLDTTQFWTKRFCRLYPTYLISIIAMCLLLPRSSINSSSLAAVILGVTSWTPWAFENNINTPGWTVGTFMFLYLFFPTAMRIISGKKKETSLSY